MTPREALLAAARVCRYRAEVHQITGFSAGELEALRCERDILALAEQQPAEPGPETVSVPESRLTPETLNAPCIFCGYNGAGYWQRGTHNKDCRWHDVGGACERYNMLAAGSAK